jgi:hypothetical protein
MAKFTGTLRQYAEEKNCTALLDEYIPTDGITLDTANFDISKPVNWLCPYGHKEHISARMRFYKGGCFACGKERHGSLAQNYPELVRMWSKKNTHTPDEISPSYTEKVIWVCKYGHEWRRSVPNQIKRKTCPICDRKSNSLFTALPEMRDQWDSEKKVGVDPETVSPYSSIKYYWRCENGHSYRAAPEKLMRKKMRCPICHSFGFHRPDIIDEWHPTKNGNKTPFDFAVSSQKQAWFICRECKSEYSSRIAYRAIRKSPFCAYCKTKK